LNTPAESRTASSRTERPIAVGALVFANLAVIWILLPLAEHAQRFYRLGWPSVCVMGLVLGSAIWFTLWFAFSRSSLVFRLAVAAVVGPLFGMVYVVGVPMALTTPARWPALWDTLFRYDMWQSQMEMMKFVPLGFWMLVWLIYILLLPLKRLRGVSLGCPSATVAPQARPYQISIWDLMLWTCVVTVPLGFLRIFLVQHLAMMFFGLLILAGFGLAFGLPVFRAAFAEKRRWIWLLGVTAYIGVLTTGIYAFFYLDHRYFFRGNPLPVRELSIITGLGCAVIYANCWALRWMGLRWLKTPKPAEGRSSAVEAPPHFNAITPQPSNPMP
jgi:hypothetical protein